VIRRAGGRDKCQKVFFVSPVCVCCCCCVCVANCSILFRDEHTKRNVEENSKPSKLIRLTNTHMWGLGQHLLWPWTQWLGPPPPTATPALVKRPPLEPFAFDVGRVFTSNVQRTTLRMRIIWNEHSGNISAQQLCVCVFVSVRVFVFCVCFYVFMRFVCTLLWQRLK